MTSYTPEHVTFCQQKELSQSKNDLGEKSKLFMVISCSEKRYAFRQIS